MTYWFTSGFLFLVVALGGRLRFDSFGFVWKLAVFPLIGYCQCEAPYNCSHRAHATIAFASLTHDASSPGAAIASVLDAP